MLNENQEPIYQVKGKWISITKKKKMYDMEDKLLYTIRNKYWTFFCDKVMVFDADGERVAIIKKSKWSWNHKYEILDTENEMSIDGKFFSLKSKDKNHKVECRYHNSIQLIRCRYLSFL